MPDTLDLYPEQEIVNYLRRKGYRVIKEEYPEAKGVSTIPKLVDFFYSRRRFYQRGEFPTSIDGSTDRKSISSFVRSREKLGLPRKVAVKEAAVIIDALFRFEHLLNLKEPVSSANILAVRPIMDRVCALLSSEYCDKLDEEIIREWNQYYNKKDAQQDFQKATEQLRKLSEKLNDNKKRRRSSTRRSEKIN